jgi:outer membrane receptor protein involved in Fe transport
VRHDEDSENCAQCGGTILANNGPIPANIESLFPDPWNADTWNLAALSPITRSYTIGIGEFPLAYNQPKYAGWLQDDWRATSRLTLNLGVRYDLSINAWANKVAVEPFYRANRPDDKNNFQPRLGFAYSVDSRPCFAAVWACTSRMP